MFSTSWKLVMRSKRFLSVLILLLVMGGIWAFFHVVHSAPPKPNILWIVWDTVRADRLSLYGHNKPTTPFLDSWAQNATVFDNCVSAANCTAPSHASMFTGMAPSEHQCNNANNVLSESLTTIAERLSDNGYQTYMFSANPHICESRHFSQGFDLTEHPWSPQFAREAVNIICSKVRSDDRSTNLPVSLRHNQLTPWSIKASGALAQKGVENWLAQADRDRPFMIFLNYMEAHHPLIPPKTCRQRIMTPEQVERSYRIDRRWQTMWSYIFGKKDYTPDEIEITRLTYDAALAELDDLFRNLITWMDSQGLLDNTIVILTADHGEHLGEHHLLDHQYSVYEPLIHVPLVMYYPKRFKPGRDSRPVMNTDIFETILEVCGLATDKDRSSHQSISLLQPQQNRIRIAECPLPPSAGFDTIKRYDPDFDISPWQRTLQAVYYGNDKLIWASDDRYELYQLNDDPAELNNRAKTKPKLFEQMMKLHDSWTASLNVHHGKTESGSLTEDQRRRLESLGYLSPDQ